jgi:hypothetical protein
MLGNCVNLARDNPILAFAIVCGRRPGAQRHRETIVLRATKTDACSPDGKRVAATMDWTMEVPATCSISGRRASSVGTFVGMLFHNAAQCLSLLFALDVFIPQHVQAGMLANAATAETFMQLAVSGASGRP